MCVYVYISICMGAYVYISICMGVHIYMYSVQDGEATSEMRARFTGEMVVLRGIFLATYERALADKNVDKAAGIRKNLLEPQQQHQQHQQQNQQSPDSENALLQPQQHQ